MGQSDTDSLVCLESLNRQDCLYHFDGIQPASASTMHNEKGMKRSSIMPQKILKSNR